MDRRLAVDALQRRTVCVRTARRAVARTLLGYPERSVGRLMTPNYVAVREHWTVREVLDYVRTHGQDSETLNVIYVVNDQGLLVDDVRIREFLLAPLDRQVEELMDRRFVALRATEDQEGAVAVFRQYDRTALPVTDTGGMLIGIVTGTVLFTPHQTSGFVMQEREIYDQFGRRRVVPVRTFMERKGFILTPKFIFIDGRTGATLYSETFREEVLYNAQQNTPALSSYFELMDKLIPTFLNTLSMQKVRGTRVLLK